MIIMVAAEHVTHYLWYVYDLLDLSRHIHNGFCFGNG
jgi:hypothetical protein